MPHPVKIGPIGKDRPVTYDLRNRKSLPGIMFLTVTISLRHAGVMTNSWFMLTVAAVLVIPEPATFTLAVFTAVWFAASAVQAAFSSETQHQKQTVSLRIDTMMATSDDPDVGHVLA